MARKPGGVTCTITFPEDSYALAGLRRDLPHSGHRYLASLAYQLLEHRYRQEALGLVGEEDPWSAAPRPDGQEVDKEGNLDASFDL